jgi:hypothetical protein
MRSLLVVLLVVVMVAAGCSGDDDDAATTTSPGSDDVGSPTSAPLATVTGADFEVLFAGDGCTHTVPSSVPAGEYTFVLTDTSERSAEMYVRGIADGHTYEEAIDLQNQAGGPGVYYPQPEWIIATLADLDAPALNLEDNQTQYDHILEPGPYLTDLDAGSGELWFCGSFEVT